MENMSLIVIFIAVLLFAAFFRMGLRKSYTGHYDERQLLVRGKANQYGFTVTILCTLAGIFLLEAPWYPLDAQLTMLLCVLVGIAVHLVYCIFHDAYYFPNQKPGRYIVIVVLALLCNLPAPIARLYEGSLLDGGRLTYWTGANLAAAVFLAVILLALLIRRFTGRDEE